MKRMTITACGDRTGGALAHKILRISRMPRISLTLLAAAISLALSLPVDRHGSAAAAPSDDFALDEVVVTARKREENLRDVPVSIGVVDGATIDTMRIQDMEDITRILPGVSFAAHQNGPAGQGQDNITIRGISSTVGNPTVGIYVDEVPLVTLTGYEGNAEPRLVDIERVEVLRGPQGTLYGASSEGGTVRFVTPDPDSHTLSGRVKQDISYTEHGSVNYDTQGVVNIPVIDDVFALRISAEYGQNSGYINNYALQGSISAGTAVAGPLQRSGTNSDTNTAVRIKGLWKVADNVTVIPAMLYQRYAAGDTSTFIPALGTYNQFNQVAGSDRDTLIAPSLTVKAGLGFADLTSITSYVGRRVNRFTDGTYFNTAAIAQYFLDTAGVPPYTDHAHANDYILGNIPSPVQFNDHFNTWTQEIRLASPADQKIVHWVGGVYLADQQVTHLDSEPAVGFSSAFQSIYGYNINRDPVLNPSLGSSTPNPNFWTNDVVWQVFDHNDTQQWAVFGQVDIDVLPTLHLGIGDRYVRATETFSETGFGFFEYGNAGTNGSIYAQKATFSTSTPKFTLTYDVNSQASVYLSAGKGFRLGGATTPNTNVACVQGLAQLGDSSAPMTYGPDHLWSYELGTKSLLFQKSLSVNAAVYYIDWSAIQQSIVIPICGGQFNANVGDAKAIGAELEVRYKPPVVPGLVVSANLGGEHAYITSTINAQTAAVGQDVLYTPKFTAAMLADYGWQITSNVNGFIRGDYEYTGKSFGSFQVSSPQYINPSYKVVNLNLGVAVGPYEVSLYAKNLFDDRTILQSPQINSIIQGYTLRPQTIGMSFQAKF
jgi:iron complex outermembrane receptor protein